METSAINETGRETDFVRRIMAGDRQAEAELIDSYGRGVRIIIRRAGAAATIIDDLCQETFRIVLEKIRRGDIRVSCGVIRTPPMTGKIQSPRCGGGS